MRSSLIDNFLLELATALRNYPGRREEVVDEVRDHLHEAMERGQAAGLTPLASEQRAVEAFGDARALATRLVAQKAWVRTRWLLPIALLLGLVMAIIDNQPTWDDTGVSVFAIVCAAGVLSILEPVRPWLWAAAIGGWFPLIAVAIHGTYGAFLALLIAFGAAYTGSLMRRAMAS